MAAPHPTDEWLAPDQIAFPEPDGLPGPGSQVKVEWNGSWYDARVQQREGNKWWVNYYGYPESSNEWVPLARMKNKDGSAIQGNASAAPAMAAAPAAEPRIPAPPCRATCNCPTSHWRWIGLGLHRNEGAASEPWWHHVHGLPAHAQWHRHTRRRADGQECKPIIRLCSERGVRSALRRPLLTAGCEMVFTFEGGTVRKFKIQEASPAPKLLPLVRAGKLPQGHGLSGKYHTQKGYMGSAMGGHADGGDSF
jgi:hypothetical protein